MNRPGAFEPASRCHKEDPNQDLVPGLSFTLETGEVHDGLDEDGVVSDVRVFGVQLGERAEERAATGDVHVADGPLEGRGRDVGPEGVDDVLPVVLVQQHQGHLTTVTGTPFTSTIKRLDNNNEKYINTNIP